MVEDNLINQEVIAELLGIAEFKVTMADNGLEALGFLRIPNRFDVVLMDCNMPEMDGYEATQKIREHESETGSRRMPIIALTANAMQGDKQLCLDAGMDDYLSKPVKLSF
jgi:CheY-like chemotaxis protein